MTDVVLTADTLRYIALFEKITRVHIKDCVDTPDKLVFIVGEGKARDAVGKKGEFVIKLKQLTGKDIQVIEFSDDPVKFLKSIFHTYGVRSVELENRGDILHATVTVDPQQKAKAIGRAGKNLKIARDIAYRHFGIQSVSVA